MAKENLYYMYLALKTDTTLLQQQQRAGVWHANDNFWLCRYLLIS